MNGNAEHGGFYDPAFTDNRAERIHRWAPWVAGYSARFVDDALHTYAGDGERKRVLDPFAGVGTTLVQARLHGYDSVGFEVNPYAALVSKVKLAAASELRSSDLGKAAEAYWKFVQTHRESGQQPPSGFRTRIPFLSPKVERKLLVARDFIDTLDSKWVADAFRVAFGAILVSVSNYTYEPSLSSRPGAGKPLMHDADVVRALSAKTLQMAQDIAWLERSGIPQTRRVVHTNDFLDYSKFESRTCDIAITSPPYLNNYHYVRNTRPQLWWLGLIQSSEDLRLLEEKNIGKYWQTVRDRDRIDLLFEHAALNRILGRLRGIRKMRGPYGGAGWANYVVSYFNDCSRFLDVLRGALRDDAIAVIVVGNSIIQGVPIKTEAFLADIATMFGFRHLRTDRLRNKRVGGSILRSSVRRGARPRGNIGLYESAVILRRSV